MLINKSHIYSENKPFFSRPFFAKLFKSHLHVCGFVFLSVLGIESRALHELSKCSVAELHSQSLLKFNFLLNAYFK